MIRTLSWVCGACLVLLGLLNQTASGANRSAHFETTTRLTLNGVVQTIDQNEPAFLFSIAVPDGKGDTSLWTLQAKPLRELAHLGWDANSIKVGDQVSVLANPETSGAPLAAIIRVRLASGQFLETSAKTSALKPGPADDAAAKANEDPLAGYYGNTVICKGPTFDCHVWFAANHRFVMFSRDRQPGGSDELRGREGSYWLQNLQGIYHMCMIFDGVKIAPLCYHQVNFEKVGDSWDIVQPNGVREKNWIIAGRH